MCEGGRPARSLRDVLAPLLDEDETWVVVPPDPTSYPVQVTRVLDDGYADSLIMLSSEVARFRRETDGGRTVGAPIEGHPGDVVDAVRRLPQPSTPGIVIDLH